MPKVQLPLKAKALGITSIETVQDVGKKFLLSWTFENNGESEWPLDVIFVRVNGDIIESTPWHATHAVPVNAKVPIFVEFTAPKKPGKYFACFRLMHSENSSFGDKVFLNLTAKDIDVADEIIIGSNTDKKEEDVKPVENIKEDDLLMMSQKMVDNVDKFADGEDLDNSIVIEGSGND